MFGVRYSKKANEKDQKTPKNKQHSSLPDGQENAIYPKRGQT